MIQDYFVLTGINVLLAWSVYVVLLSGSLSFANGGFMAVGAYVSGVLTVKFGVPLVAAAAMAGVAAFVFGVAVAFPALRARGLHLILVTVGISACVKVTIESIDYVGGIQGFSGMSGTTPWHVGILVLAVGVALWWLSRSRLQRVLDAVREDETAAAALGVEVMRVKLVCFGAGAFLAAVAGALHAHHMMFIRPEDFGIVTSVFLVLYVVLGGMNNLWGPVLGASVMTLAPEAIRGLAQWRPTVFGILIVVLLLVRPDGLLAFRSATVGSRRNGASGQ